MFAQKTCDVEPRDKPAQVAIVIRDNLRHGRSSVTLHNQKTHSTSSCTEELNIIFHLPYLHFHVRDYIGDTDQSPRFCSKNFI